MSEPHDALAAMMKERDVAQASAREGWAAWMHANEILDKAEAALATAKAEAAEAMREVAASRLLLPRRNGRRA